MVVSIDKLRSCIYPFLAATIYQAEPLYLPKDIAPYVNYYVGVPSMLCYMLSHVYNKALDYVNYLMVRILLLQTQP